MPRLNAFSLLLAVTLVACQTNQEAPTVSQPKVLAPTPPTVSCAVDAQCEKFLRCLDGVCATPPAITGEVRADTPIATFYNGDKAVGQFFLEVADDFEEQRRGLMYRSEIRDN